MQLNTKYFSQLWFTGVMILLTLTFSASNVMAEENSCQLTLSPSTIDYGIFGQDDIVETKNNMNVMSEKEILVNVYCSKKKKIAVFAQGNTDANGVFLFGDLGIIDIRVSNVTVDGQRYQTGKTEDRIDFAPLTAKDTLLGLYNNEGVVAVENNIVPEGQQMSFMVKLTPLLIKDAWRRNSDQSALNSSVQWHVLEL